MDTPFVGFEVLAPHVVYGPAHVSAAERRATLEAWATRLRAIEREAPVEVGRY